MKVQVNIYALILYVVLLIGVTILLTSLINGCDSKRERDKVIEQKIDSVQQSIKQYDRMIETINGLIGVNDSVRIVYRVKYVLKKEQIKEQSSNKDYEQIKNYLNNYF